MRVLSALWRACRQQFRFFLVVLLGYFLQVCVMPYLRIGAVTPSLLYAIIAIVTVGYGRQRTLWVGMIYGILMELMLTSIMALNLILYPLSAIFCSVFFADKSDKRLEYERSVNKSGRNMNPYLRTLLCAAANTLIYEVVNLTYISLGGANFTAALIGRALSNIVLTTLLTALIMLPVRRYLGFKKIKKEKAPVTRYHFRRP